MAEFAAPESFRAQPDEQDNSQQTNFGKIDRLIAALEKLTVTLDPGSAQNFNNQMRMQAGSYMNPADIGGAGSQSNLENTLARMNYNMEKMDRSLSSRMKQVDIPDNVLEPTQLGMLGQSMATSSLAGSMNPILASQIAQAAPILTNIIGANAHLGGPVAAMAKVVNSERVNNAAGNLLEYKGSVNDPLLSGGAQNIIGYGSLGLNSLADNISKNPLFAPAAEPIASIAGQYGNLANKISTSDAGTFSNIGNSLSGGANAVNTAAKLSKFAGLSSMGGKLGMLGSTLGVASKFLGPIGWIITAIQVASGLNAANNAASQRSREWGQQDNNAWFGDHSSFARMSDVENFGDLLGINFNRSTSVERGQVWDAAEQMGLGRRDRREAAWGLEHAKEMGLSTNTYTELLQEVRGFRKESQEGLNNIETIINKAAGHTNKSVEQVAKETMHLMNVTSYNGELGSSSNAADFEQRVGANKGWENGSWAQRNFGDTAGLIQREQGSNLWQAGLMMKFSKLSPEERQQMIENGAIPGDAQSMLGAFSDAGYNIEDMTQEMTSQLIGGLGGNSALGKNILSKDLTGLSTYWKHQNEVNSGVKNNNGPAVANVEISIKPELKKYLDYAINDKRYNGESNTR